VLGYRVSIYDVPNKKKRAYEKRFIFLTIAGFLSTLGAAYRSGNIASEISEIKSGQRKEASAISAIAESTRSSQHTRLEFEALIIPPDVLPLRKGKIIKLTTHFRNAGTPTMENIRLGGTVAVVPTADTPEVFRLLSKDVRVVYEGATLVGSSREARIRTFESPPLTSQEVADIHAGRKSVCEVVIVRWKDKTGGYETHSCQCMRVEDNGYISSPICGDHNVEISIQN
jgi:hypothetical protein